MTASTDLSTQFVLPPDSPLLANMAALWAVDPRLAMEMEPVLAADPYAVEPSKAGPPTVAVATDDGRRIYLHSRYQPIDEARRLIESVPTDRDAVFFVHGFGLGYHVELLLQRASPEAIIVVLEPDLRLLRTAFEQRDFSRWIDNRRLILITRSDRSALLLRLSGYQALVMAGLSIVAHPPSLQLHPELHRQMDKWVGEFADYCRTNMQTLVLNGRRTAENIARNIGWYVSTPGIGRLANRHRGLPAIIISAGPSLRKNKHLLASALGKAVFIAVQTTLQPLLDLGIEPHYVTSLDYHEISTRFFERLPRKLNAELVAEPKASSSIFSMYPGPVSLLGSDFADRLVREMPLDKPRLRAGATVAHLAFYLAEYMGCDPVIFIGQDLGFSDGLCYAPGTSYEDVWRPELGRFCTVEMKQWEHIVRERPILRRISDWQGGDLYTEERLFVYLQQFERDFAVSAARVIDATEGGAMKRGATPMPLAEAISRFCTQPLPASPGDHPGRCMQSVQTAIASLRQRRWEAERIGSLSRQTLLRLEELQPCIEDQSRANRIIAQIDALRAQVDELGECFELIADLAQTSQVQRFRADRMIAASKVSGVELQRRQIARDIANVRGIAEAAVEFQSLMDVVVERLSS